MLKILNAHQILACAGIENKKDVFSVNLLLNTYMFLVYWKNINFEHV